MDSIRLIPLAFVILSVFLKPAGRATAQTGGENPPTRDCPAPLLVDGHTHMGFEATSHGEVSHDGLDYLRRRGFGAVAFALPVGRRDVGNLTTQLRQELEKLETLSRGGEAFLLARSRDDLDEACRRDQMAVFPTLEHFGGVFGGHVGRVREFGALGIRSITLINNDHDPLLQRSGDSVGLTSLGLGVIAAMNREGVLPDISHLNTDEMLAVIRASEEPVIASHSNPRLPEGPPSPLTDEVVLALAARGGGVFLSFNTSDLIGEHGPEGDAMDRLMDQLDHLRSLVGIDHVGIGTDLQAAGQYVPSPLRGPDVMDLVIEALLRRGYEGPDVAKVLGENALRLMAGDQPRPD